MFLVFPKHGIEEIVDVIRGRVRLVEVLDVVQVHFAGLLREGLCAFDEFRLRVEVQVLAIHHFDGALCPMNCSP